jgi:hypothetical protein
MYMVLSGSASDVTRRAHVHPIRPALEAAFAIDHPHALAGIVERY